MGNTPPYVVQLGNFASINVLEDEANGEPYEKHSVSYRANERVAEVSIKRIKAPDNKRNRKFIISITDSDKFNLVSWRPSGWPFPPYRFEMMVERAEGQHLKVCYAKTRVIQDKDVMWHVSALAKVGVTLPRLNLYERDATKNRKMTTTKDGGIVETSLNPYRVLGRDKQRGLVVIEWKKKVWNQNPYEVTVSHYFASLSDTNNTGFSVVARIRGDEDGAGALQVEGPDFHPATALFEMFDKVLRSMCWNPNACPHCANNIGSSSNNNTAAVPARGRGEIIASNNNDNNNSAKQSQVATLQSNGENSKRNPQWFDSLKLVD